MGDEIQKRDYGAISLCTCVCLCLCVCACTFAGLDVSAVGKLKELLPEGEDTKNKEIDWV